MDFGIYAADTSKTIYLRLRDSTTGLAKTGLVYNSAGAVASYTLPLAARAAITLATQTVTGAWSSGGFVEVDATNAKGLYRLDLPNAAIASGAYTAISIQFTGVISESILIPLHTRKVNTIQVSGTTQTARDLGASVLLSSGTGTGQVSLSSGLVTLAAATHTGAVIPTVTTLTGHTAQTGDSYALANGATGFAAIDTVVDAIKVKTDFLPSATAGAAGGVFIAGTNAATTITTSLTTAFTGNLTGSVGSVTGAVGSVTGSVGSVVGHTAQTGDTYAIASGATGFTAIDTVVDTISSRLTATRAGYLDNLSPGPVATAADIAGITQAQRVRVIVPQLLERPDSGSTTYRVWVYAYDEQHKAEDLDSVPTLTVENNTGTDRSGGLGTVTKPGATTGQYYVDYTVSDAHAVEGLLFRVTATEGAVDTEYAAPTIVVDTTAVDFTSADRSTLDAIAAAATEARLAELDAANLPADVDAINTATAGLAGEAMRGTDSAALASVCTEGRLAELDAANLPADIDTINTATGGLAGAAMRGTDSAALASVCTEGRLAELDAANIPADVAAVKVDTAATQALASGATGFAAIAAFLDTEIAAILVDTGTTIPALIAVLNDLSAAEVASEISDALTVDTLIDTKTLQEAIRYIAAVCAGKLSGAGTGTEIVKGLDGTTTRATVTVDGSGNRSAITYDA